MSTLKEALKTSGKRISLGRVTEKMVDEVVEEYISKFLTNEHPTWAESGERKAVVIQDVRIVYRYRGNCATSQGNLQKARTMLQILQCKHEIRAEKREKMRTHKDLKNKATQTDR